MCVQACTCVWAHATVVLKLKCGLNSLAGLDSMVSSRSVLSGTPEFAFLTSSWDAGIAVQGLHDCLDIEWRQRLTSVHSRMLGNV